MNVFNTINKHYPNCVGAILTGSYLTPSFEKLHSDVDIIIFDSFFSVTTSLVLYQNGYKIDFTQVPINDIDNVVRNEQFDERGLLLNMIVTGVIIKDDPSKTIQDIKSHATQLFNEGIHDNMYNYKALKNALIRMRKEFNKNLKDYQKMFLINEFFSTVTQIELIKINKWHFSGKHKTNILYDLNQPFVDEIQELVKLAITEVDSVSFKKIGIYIDEYLGHKAMLDHRRLFENDHLWIDLDYKGIGIKHFITELLPKIFESPILKKYYRYFILSSSAQHRIYKNKLSICFASILNKDELIKILEGIFFNKFNTFYRFSFTPTYALNEINPKNNFIKNFGECAAEASTLMTELIGSFDEFDGQRNLIMGIISNSFLLFYLQIEPDDAIRLLYYLSSRYITNRQEQKGKTPDDLIKFRVNRYKQYHRYFQENSEMLMKAFVKGSFLADRIDNNLSKLYIPLINKLKLFLDTHPERDENLIDFCHLTKASLKSIIKDSNLDKCIIFILIFEQLQQSLLLDTHQTALELTILSQCINQDNLAAVQGT